MAPLNRSAAVLAACAVALGAPGPHSARTPDAAGPVVSGPVAAPPAEARFRVLQGGKWGYIDAAGKLVIPPRFDRAADFSEGLAAVVQGKRSGYVDPSGAWALEPALAPAGLEHRPFSSGRAVVRVGGREGAMDRTGKLVVPARYTAIEDYSEGLALACDQEECGWIDAAGNRVLGPAPMGGTAVKGGVGVAWLTMGMGRRRAVIMRVGRGALPGEYEDTGTFSEGLLAVRLEGDWGYVDADGKPATPLAFRWAQDFSEGLAAVRTERLLCGYVDRSGAFAIPARFRDCGPFRGGRARVDLATTEADAPSVAFIDRTGRPVIVGSGASPPFDSALDFVNGLAAVGSGGAVFLANPEAPTGSTLGYVDAAGKYVWKPTR